MSDERPGFVDIDTYLKLPRERETWLLKPLIPVGGSALLYGPAKLGKSYLAVQLGLALSGQADNFLEFPVVQSGKVLYLQLDTPRSLWAKRFEDMIKLGGLKYDSSKMALADRESIEYHPFDILQPTHMKYLAAAVKPHSPTAVIVDTLRESQSGDENDSTVMRNVVANLQDAVAPAALIIVSHSRKENPDPTADKNLMDDHRGSSYIVGRMDAILRLTKRRLYYQGRSIEEGHVDIERLDNGLWAPRIDNSGESIAKVLADTNLSTMRAKARALAPMIGKTEEAAMSLLRRWTSKEKPVFLKDQGDIIDPSTGEVIEGKMKEPAAHPMNPQFAEEEHT